MFIKEQMFYLPQFQLYFHDRKDYMGSIYRMKCCRFVYYGYCKGTIDMHFILLVYKYEYIMNKSSYFLDLVDF